MHIFLRTHPTVCTFSVRHFPKLPPSWRKLNGKAAVGGSMQGGSPGAGWKKCLAPTAPGARCPRFPRKTKSRKQTKNAAREAIKMMFVACCIVLPGNPLLEQNFFLCFLDGFFETFNTNFGSNLQLFLCFLDGFCRKPLLLPVVFVAKEIPHLNRTRNLFGDF